MRHGHVWTILILCSLMVLFLVTRHSGFESYESKQRVSMETYPRAEMNAFMRAVFNRAVKTNTFVHERTHETSMGTRLGRLDTLNSYAVLDTESEPTVTFTHTPGAYSSMFVYDQDNYVVGMVRHSGSYQFKRKTSPTRYLLVVCRFFVKDTGDFSRVYAYQDRCTIRPDGLELLDVEEFDPQSIQRIRASIQPRIQVLRGQVGEHGYRGQVSLDKRLLASFIEQGGLPTSDMVQNAIQIPSTYPKKLRLVPPPQTEDTGFWSVTVYDGTTYTVSPKQQQYVNSKTVRYHPMGSVELTFTNDTTDTDRNTIHVDKESVVVFRTYRRTTPWKVPEFARV